MEVSFDAFAFPSNINNWQPFYNSLFTNYDFQKTHIGLSSVSFSEQSEINNAGSQYKQKLEFRFPNHDVSRSERIILLKKVKYFKINLTNGSSFILGRNDFYQNARPKIIFKSNQNATEVEIQTISIYPTGYGVVTSFGLPSFLPIIL
ncbi:MAG TPA: hypothetical protein DDZ41_07905 [Flavobacterium sp.]|nr:hypothetical protein [Flavobacterium sp.]